MAVSGNDPEPGVDSRLGRFLKALSRLALNRLELAATELELFTFDRALAFILALASLGLAFMAMTAFAAAVVFALQPAHRPWAMAGLALALAAAAWQLARAARSRLARPAFAVTLEELRSDFKAWRDTTNGDTHASEAGRTNTNEIGPK